MQHDDSSAPNVQEATTAQRTVEQFEADAIAFVTRHSNNADVFIRHINNWQTSDHNPAVLQQNIRGILKFLCAELAKRQFRSDGSKQLRLQIIADIEAHVTEDYVDHLKQTVVGDDLVEWCDIYAAGDTPPSTP